MTCADVSSLLDSFVDSELPPPMLVAVARHAAGCAGCDGAVRELGALHEAVEQAVHAEVDGLDLARVWPAVAATVERIDARRAWVRRLRGAPGWVAAGLAIAAGAVLWLRPAEPPTQYATRARPNQLVIERLDSGSGRVELRRDRRDGTTLIMFSTPVEAMP